MAVVVAVVVIGAGAARAQEVAPPAPPATASSPPAVAATAAPSARGLTLWGIVPWGGFGVGGRFTLPLGMEPLLKNNPNLRDAFALEFGADVLHWSYGFGAYDYGWNAILPVVGVMWNVWLNEQLALYPKLDLGYFLGWYTGWSDQWGPRPTHGGLFWNVALGAMYRLPSSITLRAEAGYAGLKLGAAWAF